MTRVQNAIDAVEAFMRREAQEARKRESRTNAGAAGAGPRRSTRQRVIEKAAAKRAGRAVKRAGRTAKRAGMAAAKKTSAETAPVAVVAGVPSREAPVAAPVAVVA